MGLKHDFPVLLLPEGFHPDSSNVRLQSGEVHRSLLRFGGLGEVSDPAAPVRLLHWLRQSTGDGYLFAFQEDAIYKWQPTESPIWGDHLDAGVELTSSDQWVAVTFLDKVYGVNGKNKVLWADESSKFAPLGNATLGVEYATGKYLTRASAIIVYENYLMLGNTTEDGDTFPCRLRWPCIGNPSDWKSVGSGYNDLSETGALTGFGRYQNQLIVFTGNSIHRAWMTPDEMVFACADITNEYGCFSPGSIINAQNGDLLFLASDRTIRNIAGQELSRPIDDLLKSIPFSALGRLRARRVDEHGEVWFSIPGGAGVEENNLTLTLNRDGLWGRRSYGVTAFGRYGLDTTYTIDTVPYPTIDSWPWPTIDSPQGQAGQMADCSSDINGNIRNDRESILDCGVAATAHFSLATNLDQAGSGLANYKRLLSVETILRNLPGRVETPGALTVSVKRDTEQNWQPIGTVPNAAPGRDYLRQRLPCDLRGRHFLFRFESEDDFQFVGCIMEFSQDGSS